MPINARKLSARRFEIQIKKILLRWALGLKVCARYCKRTEGMCRIGRKTGTLSALGGQLTETPSGVITKMLDSISHKPPLSA